MLKLSVLRQTEREGYGHKLLKTEEDVGRRRIGLWRGLGGFVGICRGVLDGRVGESYVVEGWVLCVFGMVGEGGPMVLGGF